LSKRQISRALSVLKDLGLPKAQLNDRSALVLLALLNLGPRSSWLKPQRQLIGVTPIMNWIEANYRVRYAPNTRETIRRQTLHQFVQAGIVEYNPDKPERSVNSPHAVYCVNNEANLLFSCFGTESWDLNLKRFLEQKPTLTKVYSSFREHEKVSVKLPSGMNLKFSPGPHSSLIANVVEHFAPRYLPGSILLYVGDTESKKSFFDVEGFAACGLELDPRGKLPDLVFHYAEKGWLVLVEAVTSHGPVDPKRMHELRALFGSSKAGLVFVTAFPTEKLFAKFSSQIAWETEVWIASNPDHLIHFNGKRFLGPY
jgi:BsuBI/PstI restriction endonuclease domain/BsuBI/PstI restriction endonuclease HTH domain